MRSEGKKLAQVARIQARGLLHIPKPTNSYAPGTELDAEFDESLAAWGLCQADDDGDAPPPPDDKCYLWPCNVPAFNVWQAIQTQWRTASGMDGIHRTGLDYTGIATYMREVLRMRPNRRWGEVWIGLQAMEVAAINVWNERRA